MKGIDFSQSQIDNARQIHNHLRVSYDVMDIRNICLNQTFDAAICMWTTYNYLSVSKELRMFIEGVWNHLKDGGLLVLDSKNIPALDMKRVYHRDSIADDGTKISLLINKDIENNTQNSVYMYFITNPDDERLFFCDYEHVRFYSEMELVDIVGDLFEIIAVYGDFMASEYKEATSERFIVVLRKRQRSLSDRN